ncbi:MAG TPA: mercury(II) reductase [Candidatus Sulfomarinibacteraceae bacterium]|nr:mercury(II) reductase [Candidatus Sulfomarinibacteraceae bacterium]
MRDAFDLLILGSGSTAFAAAIRAAELGARVAMVERRTLGGTCANRGCLPSKNLIEAARIVHEAAHPRYDGLSPATVGVDFEALVAQKDEVVREYRAKKYASVAGGLADLELIEGDATFIDPHTVWVGDRRVTGERVLIATGSRPTIPPVPGLADVPYLTSDLLDADEAGRLANLPGSLVVLGGGYIAAELAQMFSRLGSRVTIVARSGLLSGYEPDLGRTLAEVFVAEGIEILAGSRVDHVLGDARGIDLAVEQSGAGRIVRAERLLVATGRTPNTETLGLERAGVAVDGDGFVTVNVQLRTNQPHVWAAGDVIGRQHRSQMATPVGARQGRIVADNAFADAGKPFDGTVIPRAIFTDPPIAVVGETEAEVRARHYPAVAATTPLMYVPRAGAVHRTTGLVKFIASTIDERVLGVHVIGESAPEIIHEAAMAMKFKAGLPDFIDLIHVYPTMSEALKIGAQAFSRDVTKLSCCAE